MKTITLLMLLFGATACTSAWQIADPDDINRIDPMLMSRQMTAEMEARVGRKTLKKWDSMVSDDNKIIEFYDSEGRQIGAAIIK